MAIPKIILGELREHVDQFAETGPAGASLKELMTRIGHSSTRAALIYLHASTERDHEIAKEISKRVTKARKPKCKRARRRDHGEPEGHA